jgi:CubicO group peptidase (beta-lactamase class C family)
MTRIQDPVVQQSKVQVQGTCGDRFAPVRGAFQRNLETGLDIGASVAVFIDGEAVVDRWGGYFDATYTRPWARHTIAQHFSSTKTMGALCALVLADRGEIALDAPVARYWPEFAAEGKADLTLFKPRVTPQTTWSIEWRRADLPAMNGHGNARGIAALQSVIANGGANGIRLMSDAGRVRVLEPQSDGPDLVIGFPCRWAMGFSLEMRLFPGVPAGRRAAWWAGNGGSLSFIDLDARMSIGFVPNRWMAGRFEQHRSANLVSAVYRALATTN